jgi:hypothetical protein
MKATHGQEYGGRGTSIRYEAVAEMSRTSFSQRPAPERDHGSRRLFNSNDLRKRWDTQTFPIHPKSNVTGQSASTVRQVAERALAPALGPFLMDSPQDGKGPRKKGP